MPALAQTGQMLQWEDDEDSMERYSHENSMVAPDESPVVIDQTVAEEHSHRSTLPSKSKRADAYRSLSCSLQVLRLFDKMRADLIGPTNFAN
jgi:hypothetical protein